MKDVLDLLSQNLLSLFLPLKSYASERLSAVHSVFRFRRRSSSSSSYFSCSCIVHQNDLVETQQGERDGGRVMMGIPPNTSPPPRLLLILSLCGGALR